MSAPSVPGRRSSWTPIARPGNEVPTSGQPTLCGACLLPLSRQPTKRVVCHFAGCGFDTKEGRPLRPCGTGYHTACVRVGPPFTCRRRDRRGLVFPLNCLWPLFICEACAVRSVLGRELTSAPADERLLRLERMRILDLANAWAPKTLASYAGKLQYLSEFERQHPGVTMLRSPTLDPDLDIILTWTGR